MKVSTSVIEIVCCKCGASGGFECPDYIDPHRTETPILETIYAFTCASCGADYKHQTFRRAEIFTVFRDLPS